MALVLFFPGARCAPCKDPAEAQTPASNVIAFRQPSPAHHGTQEGRALFAICESEPIGFVRFD